MTASSRQQQPSPQDSSSNGNSGGIVSLVLSVGVFVVTAAVSQWIRNLQEYRLYDELDEERRFAEQQYQDEENELRQWYHDRRLHDRLSYEDLSKSIMDPTFIQPATGASSSSFLDHAETNHPNRQQQQQRQRGDDLLFRSVSDDGVAGYGDDDDDNNEPSQNGRNKMQTGQYSNARDATTTTTTRTTTTTTEGEEDDPQRIIPPDVHPNEYFDFHPKNRNWSHFERLSEEDRKVLAENSPGKKVPTSSSFVVHHEIFNDGSEVDILDEASSSDDGSDSSEEDFVWTSSQRGIRPETHTTTTTDATTTTTPTTTTVASSSTTTKENRGRKAKKSEKETVVSKQVFPPRQGLKKYRRSESEPAAFASNNNHRSQSESASNFVRNDTSSTNPHERPDTLLRGLPTVEERSRSTNEDHQQPLSSMVFSSSEHRQTVHYPTSTTSSSSQPSRPGPPRRSLSSPNLSLMERLLSFGGESRTASSEDTSSVATPVDQQPTRPFGAGLSRRTVRAQYNARIMPEKVVMIRHGQSLGNINEAMYASTPDNAMPLTDLGWEQARLAGKVLKEKVLASGETVHFIVSPYVRTVETFHGLVSAWCDPKEFCHIQDRDARVKAWYGRLMEMGLTWNEDSRIREQDFGNYQDPEAIKKSKRERHRFGVFYYRFAHGESASDVFDRVSTFLDSLWRSFDMNRSRNYVLVTHGISIRVLLARYFRYTIDQFNILANPRNCEMIILGHNGDGRLELDGRCELQWGKSANPSDDGCFGNRVEMKGYTFYKRLRILPQAAIQRVAIRISPDDCMEPVSNGDIH